MLQLTIISTVLFFGFIILNVFMYGILTSWSAYSKLWKRGNINIWSMVNILSAALLMPPMIQIGINSPFQFLGFFIPIYLIAVGLTPDWETNKKQRVWHSVFAGLCAVCAVIWLFMFKACYFQIIWTFVLCLGMSIYTKTWKECYVYWLELLIFLIAFGACYL